MTLSYTTDIAIFGGGIAGLWLLKRLESEGYRVILLESDTLGGAQTLHSQGIIHGGLKYALGGSLTKAATTIAGMPARWQRCLRGEDAVDLRGVEVLNDCYYMWSEASFRSKLKTFLGSKSLVGKVQQLAKPDYPDFFATASTTGSLYQLPDFVVNTDSLLNVLVRDVEQNTFKVDPEKVEFTFEEQGNCTGFTINTSDNSIHIKTQKVIFCAGEGNETLVESAGLESVRTQVRPLNMVYLKMKNLPRLFVHCIGDDFGMTPRLTVTSHQDSDGTTVWYLGGEIAESGVGKSEAEQIATAHKLLDKYFPWMDFSQAEWHCFAINRAEADINNNYRPDGAFIIEEKNILAAWPTKLTLSPALADIVVESLAVSPHSAETTMKGQLNELRQHLPQPHIGKPRWEA